MVWAAPAPRLKLEGMSTESPQESPDPTPQGRRLRLPAMSRHTAVIALVLLALAVGGAGLGLAIANRLAGDERGPLAYLSRVDVGRGSERFGPAPATSLASAGPHSESDAARLRKTSGTAMLVASTAHARRSERMPTLRPAW